MNSKKNNFEYRGFVSGNTPVLLKIEHDKYNPELISTELILLGSQEDHGGAFKASLSGDEHGNLTIKGENNTDNWVTLKNLQGWSHQGSNANIYIESYEYAFSEAPIEEAENIYVNVELTPSVILKKSCLRELSYEEVFHVKKVIQKKLSGSSSLAKGKLLRDTHMKKIMFMTTNLQSKLNDLL